MSSASFGHAVNQSMVQQFTRAGNFRSRVRKASPTGEKLVETVRGELRAWFGAEVDGWRHLRTYEIPFAQPNQQVPTDLERDVRLGDGVYACGDHRSPATFDGAMRSGRMAAEAAIEDMGW